ncbi:MAG: helix-turn-helix transcriptional regulator [Ilumatobacteraceae bacterium]
MTPRRGPRSTAERLRGLLVMLPWLAERRQVPVGEMAAQFGLTEDELVKDLDLASMCGLPPFLDELIDVYFEEGIVHLGVPRFFNRSLQLTSDEGFQLLAAARVAMEIPGADRHGALARALDKLGAALGEIGLEVDEHRPEVTDRVTDAIRRCERVHLSYWSRGEDRTERDITPRRMFIDRGNWYLIADDHSKDEERIFRIDRIDGWQPLGEYDDPREVDVPATDEWFRETSLPIVTIEVGASGGWVVERYPTRRAEPIAGGWRIDVTVAREDWLGELMLRLGPTARVVAPADMVDVGARAARELLAIYERTA